MADVSAGDGGMSAHIHDDFIVNAIKAAIKSRIEQEIPSIIAKAAAELKTKIDLDVDRIALNVLKSYDITKDANRLIITVIKS